MVRCRSYKIGPFKSKRKRPNEKGVTIGNFRLEWTFVDTNLSSPLNIILKEKVYFNQGTAIVFANVFYDGSKLKELQVKNYINNQRERIAREGMAFPE